MLTGPNSKLSNISNNNPSLAFFSDLTSEELASQILCIYIYNQPYLGSDSVCVDLFYPFRYYGYFDDDDDKWSCDVKKKVGMGRRKIEGGGVEMYVLDVWLICL